MPDRVCCIVLDFADDIRKIFRRYQFWGVIVRYDDALAKQIGPNEFAELISNTQPASCRILLYTASDRELAQKLSERGFSVTTSPTFNPIECHAIMKDWEKQKRGKARARAASQ
jgi:hypothetical protein